jgi:hypothetical protein
VAVTPLSIRATERVTMVAMIAGPFTAFRLPGRGDGDIVENGLEGLRPSHGLGIR